MSLPVPLHNPRYRGPRLCACGRVGWGLCGLPFKSVLGLTLLRQEELQASRPVSHFPSWAQLPPALAPGKGGSADRSMGDSHPGGMKMECGKAGKLLHCFSLPSQPQIRWGGGGA